MCPCASSWSYWLDWSETSFSPSAASSRDRDVAVLDARSLRTNTLCPVMACVLLLRAEPCREQGSPWQGCGDHGGGRVLRGTGDRQGGGMPEHPKGRYLPEEKPPSSSQLDALL